MELTESKIAVVMHMTTAQRTGRVFRLMALLSAPTTLMVS
jgi:hypothetical protein